MPLKQNGSYKNIAPSITVASTDPPNHAGVLVGVLSKLAGRVVDGRLAGVRIYPQSVALGQQSKMANTFNGVHITAIVAEIDITTKPFKSKSIVLFDDNNHSMHRVQT